MVEREFLGWKLRLAVDASIPVALEDFISLHNG
jgi:hypothetical protein